MPAFRQILPERFEVFNVQFHELFCSRINTFCSTLLSTDFRFETCFALWSPSIRTHIQGVPNAVPDVGRTSESLRVVAGYGAGNNVVVNLENDDLISEDAFFIVKVIEAVDHPYLRALPDLANSMMTGDAEFNYRALQAMFQHAYCICHVKDSETDDRDKLLKVDLKRSIDILKSSQYQGYCSMEFDAPGEPYAPTALLIEQTLRYLA